MFKKLAPAICLIACFAAMPISNAAAQTVVAAEDFDGGDVNLTQGFDTSKNFVTTAQLFRRFGVWSMNDFITGFPAPFSLEDSNVANVGGNGTFANDFEGIIGMAKDPMDSFFTCCSFDDFFTSMNGLSEEDRTGNWTFDVSSSSTPLTLNIDMGQQSDDEFDGVNPNNTVVIEYSFDGGPFQEAMSLGAFELIGTGFSYRPFDDGDVATLDFFGDSPNDEFPKGPPATAGTHRGFAVLNSGVTKTLTDTGAIANNTILDKTDPATGEMDTFSVALQGNGNSLAIRIICDFSFEAFALDNIVITTEAKDVLLGDVNCDGEVDLLDVAPFVELLTGGMFSEKADMNQDGEVDLLDVAPFVELLLG